MPRIVFATALPGGVESLAETVDLELEGRITVSEVKERLHQNLPQGIRILESKEVSLASAPSPLNPRSTYWVQLEPLLPQDEAREKVKRALDLGEWVIQQERKGKERSLDILPMIERMEIKLSDRKGGLEGTEETGWGVELVLRNGGGRMAKPTEILGAILGLSEETLSRCEIVKIE